MPNCPNWQNPQVYVPKHFEVSEWAEITGFVARARAADLVTVDSSGLPVATLMPAVWDTSAIDDSHYGSLVMHMAKANPQWKSIEPGAAGLAIVHGPQAYISPSNYEGKLTDHKVVPTWNYQSVHLSGTVEVSADIELLRQIVTGLTEFHENGRTVPWQVSEAEPKYLEAQLHGIIAVTLRVTKVEAKYKLSQNRSAEDRKRVIADLASSQSYEDHAISEEMKKTL
jgi:transcriptional regulator